MITRKTPAQACMEPQKKGFTLTEIAIVLGIIGLILGAIWVAAASVYNNQRINQANTAVLQVLQGIRTLYSQQASIPGGAQDITDKMVNAGIVPTNLVVTGTATMRTPWGQSMYIGTNAAGDGVSIVMNGMTSALCVGVISAIFGPSHDRTLDSSSTVQSGAFGNGNGVALTGIYNANLTPTTSAAGTPGPAGTGCTAGSSTNAVRLMFGLQG